MRRLKKCTAIVALLSAGMTVGYAEADESSDVFDILRQSEYLKTEAHEVPCGGIVDLKVNKSVALCFEMKTQTLTDLAHMGEFAFSIGINLRQLFTEAGWEIYVVDTEVVYFENKAARGCKEEISISFSEIFEELFERGGDENEYYPAQFKPNLSFYKRLDPTCVG